MGYLSPALHKPSFESFVATALIASEHLNEQNTRVQQTTATINILIDPILPTEIQFQAEVPTIIQRRHQLVVLGCGIHYGGFNKGSSIEKRLIMTTVHSKNNAELSQKQSNSRDHLCISPSK